MKSMISITLILFLVTFSAFSQSITYPDSTGKNIKIDQMNQQTNRLADLVKDGEQVPSPLTFTTQFERIVIARMTFGTDLLKGLQDAVQRENIRSAIILCGIGSLTSYHVHSIAKTTLPSENIFYKAEGPYDLLNVTGYVINGRVHAHITVTNEDKAIGGHLEPGTSVYTFGIVTIGILSEDVDLNRLDDTNWR